MRTLLLLAIACLPPALKPAAYRLLFGYRIGRDVRIGFSLIDCPDVEIGDHVSIGHFNRLRHVPVVRIGDHCSIGHGNAFVAAAEFTDPRGIAERGNTPALIVGRHTGIGLGHHFDVNDRLEIGDFTTIAGKGSQFFTHYVDVRSGGSGAKPLSIGRYCMVGSAARFVPGAAVADCCVVGMGAVVTKAWTEPYVVLGGAPAQVVSALSPESGYFHRTIGWIGRFSKPGHPGLVSESRSPR